MSEDKTTLESVEKALGSADYEIHSFTNPEDALLALEDNQCRVIIGDQEYKKMSGLDFLKRAGDISKNSIKILLMDSPDLEIATRAVNEGIARKILIKPWNDEELFNLVRDSIETSMHDLEMKQFHENVVEEREKLEKWDELLRNSVKARTRIILQKKAYLESLNRELQGNIFEAIKALFAYLEKKNRWIGKHSKTVAAFSVELAVELNLPSKRVQIIEVAALLHDIGKIGISDKIISKRKHLLTKSQTDEINQHPLTGQKILSPIYTLNEVGMIVRHHHEYWDGTGFPNKLKGEEIPLGARIIGVADTFTNLIDKIYSRAKDPTLRALKDLVSKTGNQLDPKLVEAFLNILEEKRKKPSRIMREEKITLQKLQPGMMISRDIITTRGTVVLSKGQVLDNHHLDYLKEFDRLEKIFEEIFVYLEKFKYEEEK